MISSLEPQSHSRIYDLVKEAGIDVSDWANYARPDMPQTNPNYCYNWAFFGDNHVVVCLWFEDMKEDEAGIYQLLNYSEILDKQHGGTANRRKRALDMNRAFYKSFRQQLLVRVVIVHDPDGKDDNREVELRSLDPEPWHIVSYDDDTGWCRLQRGARQPNIVEAAISDPKPKTRISMMRFRAELENLKNHLLEYDGYPFESFTRGKIFDWENYKDFVFAEAGRRLECESWKSEEVGTGAILDRVIHAVEINDGPHKRNNLLKWQQFGAHNILIETRDSTQCFEVESLLFDFYTGELDAEDVFDPLVDLLGKKYSLLAYLFFIKDCSKFLPISTTNFDAVFERLGVSLKTSGQCGWENYTSYLSVIHEIRDLLEVEGYVGVRLLDAHSFCWLLHSIGAAAEAPSKLIRIENITPSLGNTKTEFARAIDWEALHRARQALGRLGEEIAEKAEKERLIHEGRPDLAERVHLVSDDHKKGYDLHSYETNGLDRCIEVKTISEVKDGFRFYTTYRQLEFAHTAANHFYYLVEGARTANPKIRSIRATSIPPDAMRAIVHEVIINEV